MLRVFEAFAGYGSQSIALRNLGIEYEVVAISEIDKYAIKAYEAIHGPANNLGDICKIDPSDIPDHDLFTYSFPCQDLSVAGKQAGLGKGTRSGLLYECEKVIEAKKPKYLLLENVKNLVGKKFKSQFDEWLGYLEDLGYTNYWKVLNAKDYGVPQNRERVFVVSILGEHKPYKFADKMPLDRCIADVLESEVDESFYIKKQIESKNNKIKINQATKKGYIEMEIPGICDLSYPDSKTRRGRVQAGGKISPTLMASRQDICYVERIPLKFLNRNGKKTDGQYTFCVDTCHTGGIKEYYSDNTFKIRKLTPRECFRLMGMRDDDIDKIQAAGISNTQQYKMAGNSIVVDVLEAIFKNLFMEG